MKGLTWVALASGPVALALWWLASLAPGLVEAWYSRGIYPVVMGPWSRLMGMIPLPVAPLLLLGLVLTTVALFVLAPPLRALSFVGASVSVLVAWFVLGWGLNYQRLSWAETHALVARGGTVADLEALAQRLAAEVGPLREKAFAGSVPAWASPGFRSAVSRAWEKAGEVDPLLGGRYGDPKAVPFSSAMSWLGIAGICIPHTGEPLVNVDPNNWQLPFTAAHEAAHLRGWAREDEANFLAFWVLRRDPDPALAYSAWGSALVYVASALEASGPQGSEAWARVRATLPSAVREDWKAAFAYWDRFRGPVMAASHAVNDLYLKSQGQSDGVKSYGRMVDLLLASESAF